VQVEKAGEILKLIRGYTIMARVFMIPVIARWTSVDPLATNHSDLSPYNYVMNNPILYIDEFELDTGKVKPAPKPIVLKGVKITATKAKKKSDVDRVGTNLFHHTYKPAPWNHDDCHCPVLDQAMILAVIIATDGLGDFLEGAAADESLEGLTTEQLNAKISDSQRDLLRDWFKDIKNGADPENVPEGLTKETLKVYEKVAKNAINAGKDARLGVQAQRLKYIEKAINVIKK